MAAIDKQLLKNFGDFGQGYLALSVRARDNELSGHGIVADGKRSLDLDRITLGSLTSTVRSAFNAPGCGFEA